MALGFPISGNATPGFARSCNGLDFDSEEIFCCMNILVHPLIEDCTDGNILLCVLIISPNLRR